MIKTIFFDCDGFLVLKGLNFSQRFSRDFDVPEAKLNPFFQNEFLRCEIGQADLKEELKKYLPQWGWKKSVDELLKYWFEHERELDKTVADYVQSLRAQGLYCCLTTNNEKYRTEYLYYHLALGTVFDEIFSSAKVGFLKPQPEFWQKVYRPEMGNKHEILVVDDDPETAESARKFGFFAHHYKAFPEFEKAMNEFLAV